jgi:hypothetical protein
MRRPSRALNGTLHSPTVGLHVLASLSSRKPHNMWQYWDGTNTRQDKRRNEQTQPNNTIEFESYMQEKGCNTGTELCIRH